ncbi:MAG: preprotein translocase subunit YajC [Bdellovibrionales bacterium]|nr:preprotein translocase subunit YajC [Bdellovibrionales bacterium]
MKVLRMLRLALGPKVSQPTLKSGIASSGRAAMCLGGAIWAAILFQGCTPPQNASGGPGASAEGVTQTQFLFSTVWFVFVAVFVYYVLVVRPDQARDESHKKFLTELKKGDDVVTTGGLIGRVHSVKDGVVTVEIASNTRVRFKAEHVFPFVINGDDAKA